jgi:MFS family permease
MNESGNQRLDNPDFPDLGLSQPAGTSERRSALTIVFLVMFIDLLGFGLVLPLLPRYGKELLIPLFPNDSQAAVRGMILGLLMASFSAMQFLFAPIWGRISDYKGRRPFLLLGLTGSVVFYALFGFASDWGAANGRELMALILLFVARIGAGIAGATVSTAQAVIADCTAPEERSRGMALIGMAFGIGFTFGPILGAGALYLFPAHRGAPGYVASAFSFIALVLGILLMPETWRSGVSGERRRWFNWGGLQTALATPTVGLLILIFFLSTLAFANFEPTLALLTQDVLHYSEEQNFLVFFYVGLVLALAQGGFYRMLARRGVGEIPLMFVGNVFTAIGFVGLGAAVAWTTTHSGQGSSFLVGAFFVSTTLAVTGFAFITPSVQSLISRRSDPARQGEILGVNQSANALSRILGPMAGVSLYALTPTHFLPFALATCLLLIVLALILRVK